MNFFIKSKKIKFYNKIYIKHIINITLIYIKKLITKKIIMELLNKRKHEDEEEKVWYAKE